MTSSSGRTGRQLQTIGWLHTLSLENGIEYWLFGGWAVDLHAGRVTRDHQDIDVAVWQGDLERLASLLEARGWHRAPEPGEDGYTGYEHEDLRLDVALLARDDTGAVYTPLIEGRGEWPPGSFASDEAEVRGVRARVVNVASLIEDKSTPREDLTTAAKDRADVAVLAALLDRG